MKFSNLPCTATALFALTAPSIALAEVTPAQVWANYQAYVRAFGGTTTATLTEAGATLTARDVRFDFALPMGLGSVSMMIGETTFTGNGDGTVTMAYLPEIPLSASFDLAGIGQGTIGMTISGDRIAMVASGEPGDIVYRYDIPAYEVEITEISLSGPIADDPAAAAMTGDAITGSARIEGSIGEMRVTEGALLTLAMEGEFSGMSYAFAIEPGNEIFGTQTGSGGASGFSAVLTLPADGVALLAIPQALRDGLSARLNSRSTDTNSFQQMLVGDTLMSSTRDSLARVEVTLALGSDGLRIEGAAESYAIEITDTAVLPLPISAAFDKITMALQSPLLAADTPQPFAYQLGVEGMTMGDPIWSAFDLNGSLPRNPASINLDLTGKLTTFIDLLDFIALTELGNSGEIPLRLHELAINDISASVAGAELTGSGAFTFDNSDLQTFNGIPAPTGTLDLKLVGGNTLMDTLVAIGLLPEEQAMGARMMMGLFARPGDGPDTLETTIEIDGTTGAISANGQRLQ